VAMIGCLWGEFPPEKRDIEWTCRELASRLRGHAAARTAIKSLIPFAQVGMVNSVSEFQPLRTHDFLDRLYADLYDYLWNECIILGLSTGRISFPLIGEDVVLPELVDSCDWYGVNYYTDLRVDSRNPRGVAAALPGERVSQMGWTWSLEGFYKAIERYVRLGKPTYITENGIGTLDDLERVRFISEHLRVVSSCIQKGFDLRGYLYWSLLDNYEWACGFRPRFGLIEVNYETLERKIKPSGRFLAGIIEQNALTRGMIERCLPEGYRF
jgi:beta-glucosidase